MSRYVVLASAVAAAMLAAVGCVGCAGAGGAVADEGEARAQESAPRWMQPSGEAEALAARVFRAHGGPSWQEVERLSFTFVVIDGDERLFEAQHDWNMVAGTDRVRWRDGDGRAWDVVVDLDAEAARRASVDAEELGAEALAEAGADAYARWVNDAYWLLMPIKLFDPGVSLSVLEDSEPHTLELSFEGVGLTPGDRYLVRANADGEVVSWQMNLQGREEAIDVEWGGYERVGPLRLPLERTWNGTQRRIVFEDVSVQ